MPLGSVAGSVLLYLMLLKSDGGAGSVFYLCWVEITFLQRLGVCVMLKDYFKASAFQLRFFYSVLVDSIGLFNAGIVHQREYSV